MGSKLLKNPKALRLAAVLVVCALPLIAAKITPLCGGGSGGSGGGCANGTVCLQFIYPSPPCTDGPAEYGEGTCAPGPSVVSLTLVYPFRLFREWYQHPCAT